MEKILNIEEVEGLNEDKWGEGDDGWRITTSSQVIILSISNTQNCCEDWGYFSSQDDLEDFIGADLFDIKIVDDCLNVQSYKKMLDYDFDPNEYSPTLFVNFETSVGTFQLTVYNEHNGYYSHDISLVSTQVSVGKSL